MRKKMLVMLWVKSPSTQALHKLLQVVLPCFLGMVRQDRERQVVMAILESMNAVIKSCQGEALQAPGILAKTSNTIKDVLKKKTVCQDVGGQMKQMMTSSRNPHAQRQTAPSPLDDHEPCPGGSTRAESP
uniref:Uncharacterized protein n=1 Tax=Cyprinus carpio carpio TaxID=630221 RepID=A0A8C1CAH4_CYPCA